MTCVQNWLKSFVHSFSQVIFLENILSGLFIIVGIGIYSYEVKNYHILLIPILANLLANATAKILGCDTKKIISGLFGFNAVLIGLAAVVFFPAPYAAYLVAGLGSILSIPLTLLINFLCGKLQLPGFTFPFIAITWLFILIAPQTKLLNCIDLTSPTSAPVNGAIVWQNALTKGLGEIYLLDSVIASLFILAAFALDNWKHALKVIGAILLSTLLALIFQANTQMINSGMYAYNAILVLAALETFSKIKTKRREYTMLVLFALLLCACFDYALATVLHVFALPVLTFPFVMVAWIVLYFTQNNMGNS